MPLPLVSIGMPVHNSNPALFDQALNSLLAQDFEDFEIVISDNASRPEIEAIYRQAATKDRRIRYVRQPRLLAAGENFRFTTSAGSGEFFFWAADDDLRAPSFLRRTLEALKAQPRAMLAGCGVAYIDENGRKVGGTVFHPDTSSPSAVRRVVALKQPGFFMDIYGLYRRAALLDLPRLRWDAWGFDYLIVFEMLLRGPIPRVAEDLFFYRSRLAEQNISLASFLIDQGATSDDPRLNWERDRAVAIKAAILHSDLSSREKLISFAVASVILRRSPHVDERRRIVRHRYARALENHSYLEAVHALVDYAALSPLAPFRTSAWRHAYARLVGDR